MAGAGLATAPKTMRLGPMNGVGADPEETLRPAGGVIVDLGGEAPEPDVSKPFMRIEHGDGSVTISLDGRPLMEPEDNGAWYANLAEKIDGMELGRISEELLIGIAQDIDSRKDWVETRAQGIKLLGLKLEVPNLQGATDGAPIEGMSKVRDSMLLEAVLRFQANARSELLPTDGPVKVREDDGGEGGSPEDDDLANLLEQDFNHYLTAVATEYYPDTDRMLLMTGFGGDGFKKVYFCPLRNRPASDSVDAEDLIVNNNATDLANARRVTHRITMRPSTVVRMQILGAYRDIPLEQPKPQERDSAQRERDAQQGVTQETMRADERDREIYECYCELQIKGYEHKLRGKETGLELPYRVTIDVTSRHILSVCRNFREPEKDELPTARKVFVKYPYVPGLGFYDIGLVHILGNATNAITAATREMLDNGMFANFPGFLYSKGGSRQQTNIFRVPPGGGQQVDTLSKPIRDMVMPLPYNTEHMPSLMALVASLKQDGQRLGGTSELQVGEGRPDAPVGTTLAMIDQATKIENSVHKRLHAAQAEEFQLLKEVFREHPESFWERGCASKTKWTRQLFLAALKRCDLIPQADPNTSSHAQRAMKIMGLKQLQTQNPSMYDPKRIDTIALQAMGWTDPEQFFVPPEAMGQPPPELQEMMAKMKALLQEADAKTMTAQAKMDEVKAKAAQGGFASGQRGQDAGPDPIEAKAKLMNAETDRGKLALDHQELLSGEREAAKDREAKHQLAFMDLAREVLTQPQDAAAGARELPGIEREVDHAG